MHLLLDPRLLKAKVQLARKVVQKVFKWSLILGLPLALGLGILAGKNWWNSISSPPQLMEASAVPEIPEAQIVKFQIPQGTATQQIGRDLEAAGLIRSARAWDLWARWLKWQDPDGEFKAGTYALSRTQSLEAIARQIWQGKVIELSFTIPEGWSIQQMATYFEAQGFFPATEFIAAASTVDRSKYPWLPADLPHLEGFLYPDTYKLNGDQITAQAVVNQMLQRFEQLALPLYEQQRNQTQLDLREWVTLASIVEKEAVVANERQTIAGVFVRRLEEGLPLGADPTVEYGLGIRQTADQPLTLAQVNTPSPYNTYINPGLPPTPIASPGIASLQATLNPEDTPYLYFVARYDGTHVFSRTLSEHEAAQAAIRRQQQLKRQ